MRKCDFGEAGAASITGAAPVFYAGKTAYHYMILLLLVNVFPKIRRQPGNAKSNNLNGGLGELGNEIETLLQSLKEELSAYESKHEVVQSLIQEEQKDIETALSRINTVDEDAIPQEWLQEIPTLLSPADWQNIWVYGKVPVPYDIFH
ncbi:hypothetical protein [Weizmannia acidilactici]|uniref:hypothetical protein n=1 Tax=Weizmannia acidilactici TaxID=2607726 RepID=UPI00127E69C2|nr:hypothetical protein [Weizmannia acidilactici]GER74081.1 hypothetical protein BpPP18_21480 [Weizmannia acidilactici]